MTTYLGQLKNRVEINKQKLSSLETYKKTLLDSKDNIDADLLTDRLTQIDMEYDKLKKAIHANQKAEAHYNAAYDHLVALRTLDAKLQVAKTEEAKENLENDIITHTSKLEKHLAILPERLVEELQQQYLEYTKNNPLIIEEEPDENPASDIPMVAGSLTDNVIYHELLDIFEAEKKEFDEIKVFDSPKELEDFIAKYSNLKINCYTRLAMLNHIGKVIEEKDIKEEPKEVEEENKEELQEKEMAPIIAMLSLVDGIEITTPSTDKLHISNVKISNIFKDELTNANWLYNVIHSSGEILNIPEPSFEDFMQSVSANEKNKVRIEELKKSLTNLSDKNLIRIYNEYYKEDDQKHLTTVLKILISEKVNELA